MKNLKLVKISDTSLMGFDKSLEWISSHAYLVNTGAKWRLLNEHLGEAWSDGSISDYDFDIQYQMKPSVTK